MNPNKSSSLANLSKNKKKYSENLKRTKIRKSMLCYKYLSIKHF